MERHRVGALPAALAGRDRAAVRRPDAARTRRRVLSALAPADPHAGSGRRVLRGRTEDLATRYQAGRTSAGAVLPGRSGVVGILGPCSSPTRPPARRAGPAGGRRRLRVVRRPRPGRRGRGVPHGVVAGDDRGAAALTDDPPAATELLVATREALGAPAVDRRAGAGADGDRSGRRVGVAELGPRVRAGPGATSARSRWPGPCGRARPNRAGWCTGRRRWSIRSWPPGSGSRCAPSSPAPLRWWTAVGAPVMEPTAVVSVLLDRLATGDLPAVAGTLAAALSPIDPQITQASITDGAARTADGQAYTVAVLRGHRLPGRSSRRSTTCPGCGSPPRSGCWPRTPGSPGRCCRRCAPRWPTRLDGVAGWSVRAVDPAGGLIATLVEEAPKPGTTVAVGLDRAVQTAAEDAVEPVAQQAMLVAVAALHRGPASRSRRTARPTRRGRPRWPAGTRPAPRSRSSPPRRPWPSSSSPSTPRWPARAAR